MRTILLTIAMLIVTLMQVSAMDNAALWQKGNDAYKQKDYEGAAGYYEQIAASRPVNAELYYNLGNTYYRLNKVAPAILNYERALHIKPDYKEAKDNLMLTQGRMSTHILHVEDIFFVNWWSNVTAGYKEQMWAVTALLAFVLLIGILLFNRMRKPGMWRIPTQIAGFLGLVWICLLMLAFVAAQNSADSGAAVVMQNDAPLMSIDQKGKPLSLLPEGTTVKIKSNKGDLVEVALPDGRTGWLQQSLINKI